MIKSWHWKFQLKYSEETPSIQSVFSHGKERIEGVGKTLKNVNGF